MKNIKLLIPLIVICNFLSASAHSEELELAKDITPTDPATKKEGWSFGVDVGATTNWNFNRKFVGITDGHFLSFGGKIGANANFTRGMHEWKNNISWLETFNLIPSIEGLIKSADQLDFSSTYLINFNQWWGYFAQFKLNTSTFTGTDKRASDVNYVVTELDGTQTTTVDKTLELTTPFQPLYLQQSTGIFVNFFKYDYFTWSAKVGPAARENFADNQLIITKEENNVISINRLQNTFHIGPLFGTDIIGHALNNKLSYGSGVEMLYAAARWPMDKERTAAQRLNVEIYANLSFKFYSWMALTWDFKAIRVPDILEDFQLQSNLLLTFSYKY